MNALAHWLQSFEFLWPWMVAALPLPWLLKPWLKPSVERQLALVAPILRQRLIAIQNQSPLQLMPKQRERLPLLFIFMWLMLILAAMRPVWFLTPTPFESSGRDMILSVDLSGSMEKPDMIVNGRPVDRLTALKSVVDDFIEQRQGDRMGLIVFGTQAFLVSPLTYDLTSIQQLLAETQIGMAGNNTAIGDSIALTIKHLQQLRQTQKNKAVLVLLTDGSNNAGAIEPLDAAKKAAEIELVIHTIAFGNVQAARGLPGGQQLSSNEIDLETLQQIAEITDGEAFVAAQTDQLVGIYQRINELETTDFTLNQYRARSELYSWPLALALLFSMLLSWQRVQQGKRYG